MPAQTKTIEDLRKELKAKTKKLAKLRQQRRKAAAALAAIDKQIASLAGRATKPGPKRKVAKKKAGKPGPKKKAGKKTAAKKKVGPAKRATGTPLLTYVQNALDKAADGMRVKEVVGAVKKAGYKSLSKDFYGIVATTLRNKKFKRIKRGLYKLAK